MKTLGEIVTLFDDGYFSDKSLRKLIDVGWEDWFCRDSSLFGRFSRLMPKLRRISKSKLIDPDKVFLTFLNICPVRGEIYDKFSIFSLDGTLLYTVVPLSLDYNTNKQALLYIGKNEEPDIIGSLDDVYKYFGV